MNRRYFLTGSLGLPLMAQKKRSAPVEQPNILLILADDLAAWMLGCYGNKEIRTPHIDLLARGGTRFASNFVCTPICSASRATLFTGRVPRQHGVHDFLTDQPIDSPPQGQAAPPPSFRQETMISDILAAQGYNCGYVGKWHMGEDRQPQHQLKFWYTMLGGSSRYQDPTMCWNGQIVEEKGYLADLMTAKANEFLDQQTAGKPFFLTVSYFNPHTPYNGHPQKYYDLYAGTRFETVGWEPPARHALREKNLLQDIVGNLRKCAASTTALDDQIPLLLNKLQQRGLRDNTLVIFCGDNGYLLGRHGLWSKGLASDPINMYEEVMQVPMIWNWPGRVPVEGVRPELVSFYDVLPALCELTGASLPAGRNYCGRSYLPLALGRSLPKKEPWRTTVFGHFRNTEMARDSRYKLVLRDEGKGPGEFYDLRTDPRERNNQYENPAHLTVRDNLTRALQAWRQQYR
ncbi:MAG: sulfatase-like hydrolase/transferase [Acidobacteria bacterium]|nr:sulfatase-like hydrolase/transferase [Acidobacteriota bacterium]